MFQGLSLQLEDLSLSWKEVKDRYQIVWDTFPMLISVVVIFFKKLDNLQHSNITAYFDRSPGRYGIYFILTFVGLFLFLSLSTSFRDNRRSKMMGDHRADYVINGFIHKINLFIVFVYFSGVLVSFKFVAIDSQRVTYAKEMSLLMSKLDTSQRIRLWNELKPIQTSHAYSQLYDKYNLAIK